jgi:hypothetical protein
MSPVLSVTTTATELWNVPSTITPSWNPKPDARNSTSCYYNPRLEPRNYLDGPLSTNPATRLRQMLARPGIIVSPLLFFCMLAIYHGFTRLLREFATVSAHDAP